MTQVEDQLSKNILAPPPYLETPKDIATKSGETHVRDTTLPNFHDDRREISVPGQKIHNFPYRELPSSHGSLRPMLHMLESFRI